MFIILFIVFIVSDSINYSNVKSYKHNHITLISLNRPDDKNQLNVATLENLRKAISNFENDCSTTIAVLYGEGGSFCAGLEPKASTEAPQLYNVCINMHFFPLLIFRFYK